jgi:hypothetical protein
MKKRAFLLPLSVSLTGLAATSAQATPVQPVSVEKPTVGVPSANNVPPVLILQRTSDSNYFAYHTSHASHASHRSHYSGR